MANLSIRNLDDAVYQKLKESAELNHRSLEAEARVALMMGMNNSRLTPAQREERIQRMRALRASTKPGVGDLAAAIREERDRSLL